MTEDQLNILRSACDVYRANPIGLSDTGPDATLSARREVLYAILILAEAAAPMLAELAAAQGAELVDRTVH